MDLLRQVVGLEYQALALVAAPLTSAAACWGLRQVVTHLRDRRVGGYAARLVAWAEQAIPDKSARYHEVAALLSGRFPMLSGEQVEVLIESEVLGLKTALRGVQASSLASDTRSTPHGFPSGASSFDAQGSAQSAHGAGYSEGPVGVQPASTSVPALGGAAAPMSVSAQPSGVAMMPTSAATAAPTTAGLRV